MFKITLRRKFILSFLGVGLLPLIAVTFLTIAQIQNSLRETVSESSLSLVDETMESLEKTTANIYLDIELLADNPLIRSKTAGREEKLSEMKKMKDIYKIFEDVTLIDLNGNVIVSTDYKYRGEWVSKEWYLEAKKGNTSISPVHIILSPYKIVVSSATPVINKNGEIIAVIAGQLNMEKIWEIIDGVKVGKKGFAFLINKEGRFIAYPEKEKILSKVPYPQFIEKIFSTDKGTIAYTDENGKEMICGFISPSDPKLIEKGWKLIATQPEDEAFALLILFQKQIVLIFLGGLAFILIASSFLSNSIVKPVKKLTDTTREIAAGKLETKVKIRTRDEIGELAESFNRMTENLRKSREALEEAKASLEIKVKERTKELEEARASLEIKVRARTIELEELAGSLDEKVKERTKTLQGKVEELERFHRLTVGRELKMTELKKEIKKLKEELKTKTKQ